MHLKTDVVIIGGGISGLWTANLLLQQGYQVLLLENNAIGCGQTGASQGIIHGGVKYSLKGTVSNAHREIGQLPERWRKALEGRGELNLQAVALLAPAHWLWSTGSLISRLTLWSSRALRSQVKILKKKEFPEIFKTKNFRGGVYELSELVLNIPTLLKVLFEPIKPYAIKIKNIIEIKQHSLQTLLDDDTLIHIEFQKLVITAGEGAEIVNQLVPHSPPMQRRPLQMVMIKWEKHGLPLYAHCMDGGTNPRVTVTTHYTQDNKMIWYLGGQLAEEGATRTQLEQLKIARAEMEALFSWISFEDAHFESFYIQRAEEAQVGNKRPDSITLTENENCIHAWPTKLTFAPLLGEKILKIIEKNNVQKNLFGVQEIKNLPTPKIAKPVWDVLFHSSIL